MVCDLNALNHLQSDDCVSNKRGKHMEHFRFLLKAYIKLFTLKDIVLNYTLTVEAVTS